MKKSTKTAVIISSVVVVIVVLAGIGIAKLIGGVSQISGQVNDYSATVQKFEASPKEFAAGETAQFGPYDVKVVSVERNYTPSTTEDRAIQKKFMQHKRNSDANGQDHTGYSFTNENAQYALVTLNVKHNEARADYDYLDFSTGSWLEDLGKMRLSDMICLVVTPDTADYTQEKQMKTAAKEETGTTMTMLYRLPNETTELTFTREITLFTKVSALVGTEGMPRKDYQYTIVVRTQ